MIKIAQINNGARQTLRQFSDVAKGVEGAERPGRQLGGAAKGRKWGDNGKMGALDNGKTEGDNIGKNWGDKGVSSISRLLGAAKLQSAPGANNSRYAAAIEARKFPMVCEFLTKNFPQTFALLI